MKCGQQLALRPEADVQRDLGQQRFLLDAVDRWVESGQMAPAFARELVKPHRAELKLLMEALDDGAMPAPIAQRAPSTFAAHAQVEAPRPEAPILAPKLAFGTSLVPKEIRESDVVLDDAPLGPPHLVADGSAPVIEAPTDEAPPPVPESEPPRRRPLGPLNMSVTPMTAAELLGNASTPPRHAARVRHAVVGDAADVLHALSSGEAPPPSEAERIIEKESTWDTVLRPFLYDNFIWFIGAFCVVTGSLFVVSQVWNRVGDVWQPLIVLGLLLAYAAGFVGAGYRLATKINLPVAGRILATIGAAIGPVALIALEPLRAKELPLFGVGAAIGLIATTLFVRVAASLFDARLAMPTMLLGGGLLAWELVVPSLGAAPELGLGLPLLALFAGVQQLRKREPPLERPAQGFAAFALLYLVTFDAVRSHFDATVTPGLTLYGPGAIALGWIALRAEYLRHPPEGEKPKLSAMGLGAMALVAAGAACSVTSEASAAAAALLATLALGDGARAYRRPFLVALAGITGLFAYYLSPDLIPHGIDTLIHAARTALGVPPSQPLPIAFAGITTLPYVALLAFLAHRARSRGQAWMYRPLAWVAALDVIALGLVSHSSEDVRAALPASVGLVLMVGAALWLAPTTGAGYLFAFPATLLCIDLAPYVGLSHGALALGAAGAALLLALLTRVVPSLQRAPLLGMAAFLAITAPFGFFDVSGTEPLVLVLSVTLLAHLAVAQGLHTRFFGFTAAALATALATIAMRQSSLPIKAQVGLMFALAFGTLALANRERERRFTFDAPLLPFGMKPPLLADGFSLWADPLALLAAGFGTVALYRSAWDPQEMVLRIALGISAVHVLFTARRYGWGWLTGLAWLFAMTACAGATVQTSLLGLALAGVSVLLHQRRDIAEKLLHCSTGWASLPAGLFAAGLPLLALATHWHHGAETAWIARSLWLGVVTHLVLLRWRPLAGAWLVTAVALALGAIYLPGTEWTPVGAAWIGVALALLALIGATWWDTVTWVLGYGGRELARVAGVLVHAMLGLALILYFDHPQAATATYAAELLTVAYVLLARADNEAFWLTVAGLLGVAAFDPEYTVRSATTLPIGGLVLAVLANLVRAVPRHAELALGVRPAARPGYALSAASLVCLLAMVPHLLEPWTPALTWQIAVAGLAVALAGRALGFAPLVAASAIIFQLAIWVRFTSLEHFPMPALAIGTTLIALAVAVRRFPELMCRILIDRSHVGDRDRVLRASLVVVGCLLALTGLGSGLVVYDPDGAVFAQYLAYVGALALLAFLAAPSPAWFVTAGTLWLASGAVFSDDASVPGAFIVMHALLIASALVRWAPAWRGIDFVVRLTSAEGHGAGSQRRYSRALSMTATLALVAATVFLAVATEDRWFEEGKVDATGVRFAILIVVAGLHLLVHRRGAGFVALVLLQPGLAMAYSLSEAHLGPALAAWSLVLGLLSFGLLSPHAGTALRTIRLPTLLQRRKYLSALSLAHLLLAGGVAIAAVGLELGRVQMPLTYSLIAAALLIAGVRHPAARALGLLALPVAVHLALACLGIHLATGRPQEAILGPWALSSALLAIGAERLGRKGRTDVLAASHFYFAIGVLEIGAELWRMPGMKPSEMLMSGLAIGALGTYAALRAIETKNEVYAYLTHFSLGALYLLVRLQSHLLDSSQTEDADALAMVVLAFAFLGVRALADRLGALVFERPARVISHLLPLVGLFFAPGMTGSQGAAFAMALALHYACLAWATSGGRTATLISGLALNAALAVTWIDHGVSDPQFYAIPFGATLLVFAYLFRNDLDVTGRFWLRTVGILVIYVASASSALLYSSPGYVILCAAVCIGGVLLGVALRVRSYVYLGTACLLFDVLGNMARYGLRQPLLGGVFLTAVGLALVGGWVYFHSRREELLRRYHQIQELMTAWE